MIELNNIPHNNHFLDIRSLDVVYLQKLISRAQNLIETQAYLNINQIYDRPLLQLNLFYENSTRTASSFEIAGKRLGGQVVTLPVAQSSVKKGESLYDTALTLNAMNPDIIVVRHPDSGAPNFIAKHVSASVINAGDGTHEHPSQALLDILTILDAKGKIEGLKIAICGDILHSRVARSNLLLLSRLGAQVRLIAPTSLLPSSLKETGVLSFTSMEEGLQDVDVIMMLRIQHERMDKKLIPSLKEYAHFFGLSEKRLRCAKKDAIVMHPGPMNRRVEISDNVADGVQSLIRKQVELGVAARMAIIQTLYEYRLKQA